MLNTGKAKRILIVDWDVHHGNGTQSSFYNTSDVLYISLHRFSEGFYPESGTIEEIGQGNGEGFNINIPWPGKRYGDKEYLYAFQKVVIPVAKEFEPDLVLVSCGFDAAKGDYIGEMSITPDGYARMTRELKQLANGKLVLALEGMAYLYFNNY